MNANRIEMDNATRIAARRRGLRRWLPLALGGVALLGCQREATLEPTPLASAPQPPTASAPPEAATGAGAIDPSIEEVSAAAAVEPPALARARLVAVEGMPGVGGDARVYRDDAGPRLSLSLTDAAPGAYGVYLGDDCGRADNVDPQRTKANTKMRSQLLVDSIGVGPDGKGAIDVPLPQGYDGQVQHAVILMPKDVDSASKKLACGHLVPEPAARTGS